MHTRPAPWYRKFVPELYEFMSKEHVKQMGITGEEFGGLLEVRTVEELDAFLKERLVEAAVAAEAADVIAEQQAGGGGAGGGTAATHFDSSSDDDDAGGSDDEDEQGGLLAGSAQSQQRLGYETGVCG